MPEEWLGAVNTTFDGTRGLSRSRTGRWCATRSPPIPQPGSATAPSPACSSSCSTPASACRSTSTPGASSPASALDSPYGKTEAWLIVEAEPDAAVWVGWTRDVELDEVRGWMRDQDAAAMLATITSCRSRAGDAVYVPAGTAHAIGAGILMVELQEPTDFSVLLEWEGFELSEDEGHLEPRLGPRARGARPPGGARRRRPRSRPRPRPSSAPTGSTATPSSTPASRSSSASRAPARWPGSPSAAAPSRWSRTARARSSCAATSGR